MDMITRIQLEDALDNRSFVDARIKEVALAVGRIMDEFKPANDADWEVSYYHIDMQEDSDYPEERKHLINTQVKVNLRCKWSKRPPTVKYGKPSDDADYEDEYSYSDDYLERRVQFPRRYLLTDIDEWRHEVEEKASELSRWWAAYHLPGMRERLKEHDEERERIVEAIKDYERKSGES